MDALKFTQLEYLGAFSFASGLVVLFVGLYVSSMKARIKESTEASKTMQKEASNREHKNIEFQVKLINTIDRQAEVISRFMQLEETVLDLQRRVIKIEP